MKTYAAFCGAYYYPSGGWDDLFGLFDTIEEAKDALLRTKRERDWSHIVDLRNGTKVWEA